MIIFGNQINTPRLCLRKIEQTDLQLVTEWSNSEAAHGDYLTPDRMDEAKALSALQSGLFWNDMNKIFMVELKDATPIGTIHYWIRSEDHNCAVMALKVVDQGTRCQGYGTEAQKYLIMQLFERGHLGRVEMYTDIGNRPQQRCLEKLGFELADSLTYLDHQVQRIGYLYRLSHQKYSAHSLYQYHYE